MEFKAFPKIERVGKMNMFITQKIHGTNAQVFILEEGDENTNLDLTFSTFILAHILHNEKVYSIRAGSRTRWITPQDDNYGFARFVSENAEEFVKKLGPGQHFGEWAGPGINSGEGLTEKTFILFDHWKFPVERPLPPQTTVVPVLFKGQFDLTQIDIAMNDLKTNGSKLVPGFMRPEGIVLSINGERFKKVFEAEETQWKKSSEQTNKLRALRESFDASPYLQPVRLEKLLSRDERYLIGYPETLPQICKDYVQDLVDEGQIPGTTEDEIKALRKSISKQAYVFIKETVKV